MCYNAFISSPIEIDEIDNDNNLFLKKLDPENKNVEKMFKNKYIYELFTTAGCACGISQQMILNLLSSYKNIEFEIYGTELIWTNTDYNENILKDEKIEVIKIK